MVDKIIVKYSSKSLQNRQEIPVKLPLSDGPLLNCRVLFGFAQINDKAIAKNVDVVASDNSGHEIRSYKPDNALGIIIAIDFRDFLDVESVAIGAVRIALGWPQQTAVHHVDATGISGNVAANKDGIALVRNN